MVSLTIDGKQLDVREGATVLEAAEAAGIEIPSLCRHEGIRPYGACRLCTVEITERGRTRLQAACTYPVAPGMEVTTDSERLRSGRQVILEYMLARCPEVEAIKQLARRWGVRSTALEAAAGDCVLCGLCVRACQEVIGAEALGYSGRGPAREVGTAFGRHPESCIGCGLCAYVCPTGSAKTQMEARTARRLRQAVGTERTCRYMLMGLVSAKTCPENIECWQCPYDQLMEFAAGTHPALAAPPALRDAPRQVGAFSLSPDRAYHPRHTWASREGAVVRVGVDHFLTALLGPTDEVELRDGELQLTAGERTLSVPLPLAGEVLKVNPDVETLPRLVSYSPYHRGWVALVRPAAESWDEGLLKGAAATSWLQQDVDQLARLGEGVAWNKLHAAFFADERSMQ